MPSALATGHPVSLHLSTFTPTAPCGAVSASVAQFPPRGPESTPEGRFHRKLKHSGGVWQSNDGLRRAAALTAYYPRLLTNGDAGRHRRRSGQFRINGALRRRLRVVRLPASRPRKRPRGPYPAGTGARYTCLRTGNDRLREAQLAMGASQRFSPDGKAGVTSSTTRP